MTTIRYQKRRKRYKITVSGHSNFKDKGKDTICSAVSTLTFALIRTLSDYQSIGKIHYCKDEYDDAKIELSFICLDSDVADMILSTALNGYKILSENYPDNIQYVEGFSIS